MEEQEYIEHIEHIEHIQLLPKQEQKKQQEEKEDKKQNASRSNSLRLCSTGSSTGSSISAAGRAITACKQSKNKFSQWRQHRRSTALSTAKNFFSTFKDYNCDVILECNNCAIFPPLPAAGIKKAEINTYTLTVSTLEFLHSWFAYLYEYRDFNIKRQKEKQRQYQQRKQQQKQRRLQEEIEEDMRQSELDFSKFEKLMDFDRSAFSCSSLSSGGSGGSSTSSSTTGNSITASSSSVSDAQFGSWSSHVLPSYPQSSQPDPHSHSHSQTCNFPNIFIFLSCTLMDPFLNQLSYVKSYYAAGKELKNLNLKNLPKQEQEQQQSFEQLERFKQGRHTEHAEHAQPAEHAEPVNYMYQGHECIKRILSKFAHHFTSEELAAIPVLQLDTCVLEEFLIKEENIQNILESKQEKSQNKLKQVNKLSKAKKSDQKQFQEFQESSISSTTLTVPTLCLKATEEYILFLLTRCKVVLDSMLHVIELIRYDWDDDSDDGHDDNDDVDDHHGDELREDKREQTQCDRDRSERAFLRRQVIYQQLEYYLREKATQQSFLELKDKAMHIELIAILKQTVMLFINDKKSKHNKPKHRTKEKDKDKDSLDPSIHAMRHTMHSQHNRQHAVDSHFLHSAHVAPNMQIYPRHPSISAKLFTMKHSVGLSALSALSPSPSTDTSLAILTEHVSNTTSKTLSTSNQKTTIFISCDQAAIQDVENLQELYDLQYSQYLRYLQDTQDTQHVYPQHLYRRERIQSNISNKKKRQNQKQSQIFHNLTVQSLLYMNSMSCCAKPQVLGMLAKGREGFDMQTLSDLLACGSRSSADATDADASVAAGSAADTYADAEAVLQQFKHQQAKSKEKTLEQEFIEEEQYLMEQLQAWSLLHKEKEKYKLNVHQGISHSVQAIQRNQNTQGNRGNGGNQDDEQGNEQGRPSQSAQFDNTQFDLLNNSKGQSFDQFKFKQTSTSGKRKRNGQLKK